jgi:glycosyltransferase involved in cell wall biosynthesis
MLRILNIGLDRDILQAGEARDRQQIYARALPASLSHIVKASLDTSPARVDVSEDIAVFPCPVRHWSLFVPAAIRRGTEILRNQRFDIIQVQEPFISGLAGAWLSRRFNIPLVVGVFSDEIDNPVWVRAHLANRAANVVGKRVLRAAAAVRCDSQYVASKVASIVQKKVQYVPFLITHADRFLEPHAAAQGVRTQLLQGSAGPLLLTVARLEPEKNVDLSLRSFAEALKRFPEAVFCIVGDGHCRGDLEVLAQQVANGRVRFLGRIPNADVPAYYQAADLTLLSSTRESAARTLSESLLAGTPILTTSTAGVNEVVQDGETGRVIAVGDEAAFTNALVELCSSPERLAAMGAEGKARTAKIVTQDGVIEGLRVVYSMALAA